MKIPTHQHRDKYQQTRKQAGTEKTNEKPFIHYIVCSYIHIISLHYVWNKVIVLHCLYVWEKKKEKKRKGKLHGAPNNKR